MNLRGKTAVVTGASDGIGLEVVKKLAEAGVNLAIMARSEDKLNEIAGQLESQYGVKVKAYKCDIRLREEIKNAVDKIVTDFEEVQILVNNAGIWQKKMQLDEIEDGVVEDVINTDLTGHIFMTKYLLPVLKKQDEAAIINVSSRSGVTAQPGQIVYSAAKWGMKGFTDVLRVDLKETKIKVAGVYQGGIRTKMFEKTGDVTKDPIETFTEASDLAGVIVFMLSRPPKIWLTEVMVER